MKLVTRGLCLHSRAGLAAILLAVALSAMGTHYASLAQASTVGWNVQSMVFGDPMGVACSGSQDAWVADAVQGRIYHTSDAGATWDIQATAPFALYGIAFADVDTGWAVGGLGTTWHTTDGGATWTGQSSEPVGTQLDLYAVTCTDDLHAWAVGVDGVVCATTDGGSTWATQSSGTSQTLHGVGFANDQDGWAVGFNGAIVATTDGGSSWTAQTSPTAVDLYDVVGLSASRACAVGRDGVILLTTDGGATWTEQSSGTTEYLYGLCFQGSLEGWAAGYGGTILHTADGGTTWSPQDSATTADLCGIAFSSTGRGWAIAQGATLCYGVDVTPPTTTATGLFASPYNDWDDSGQVSLTAADNSGGCGLAATYYTVDGGPQQSYSGPFDLTEGAHTVTYWSVDLNGNTETTESGYVSEDLTSPTFTVDGLAADDHSDWQDGACEATIHASDSGGSGLATVCWTVDGGPLQTCAWYDPTSIEIPATYLSGSHVVQIWVLDGAGNSATPQTWDANIDLIPPVTTSTGLAPTDDAGWTNHAQAVTLAATDQGGSGLAGIYYDSGPLGQNPTTPWGPYSGPLTISTQGSTYVDYGALDGAGNWATPGRGWVNIDEGRPTCVALANATVKTGKRVQLRYRVNDPLPSCGKANATIRIYRHGKLVKKLTTVKVAVNKALVYSWRVTLRKGSYTWVVSATDIAGNAQLVKGTRLLRVT